MTGFDQKRHLRFYVSAILAGAIVALALGALGETWNGSSSFVNGFVALLALALTAEISAVGLSSKGTTFSVAFIPFLAATFLFQPIWAMVIVGVTQFSVDALVRKKPAIRLIFNTSKGILAVGLSSAVFQMMRGRPSTTEFFFAPTAVVAAGVTFFIVDSLAVGYAVALSEGQEFRRVWVKMYGGTVLYDIFASPIPALLAYLYVNWQLGGVALLAIPLFIVRHVYSINLRLEQANRDLLELMVKAIEARDPYTSGHSQRVSQYARIIARDAGLSWSQVEHISIAALLHDVGKIYEEYAPLLRKEGRLATDEKKLLQTHPIRSAELVATISNLRGPVAEAVRHHHENFDGSGYPDGKSGDDIPVGARVIMLADTLDAMTTDRPYRRALTIDRVVDEVKKYSSRQFDPHLADVMIRSTNLRKVLFESGIKPAEPPVLSNPDPERHVAARDRTPASV